MQRNQCSGARFEFDIGYIIRLDQVLRRIADKVAASAGLGRRCESACSGDGTVNEVANGVYGHANAAQVIPIGSGNIIQPSGGPKAWIIKISCPSSWLRKK